MILNTDPTTQPLIRASFLWLGLVLIFSLALTALRPPVPLKRSAPPEAFSAERAFSHLKIIAAEPHPLATPALSRVQKYLIEQLSSLGLAPEVLAGIGTISGGNSIASGPVQDIVARLRGTQSSGAIVLLAHYDSVDLGPGAADDGAGVAAILEAARAITAGNPLKNDLIVVLTDGEELGLLGANLFASSSPLMQDVAVVLNFEARGNRGCSLLFETSPNNRALLNEVVRGAPDAIGSSLFYSLYKMMPNATDYTVFRRARVAGLNFAFGQGFDAYHTRLDTPEHLDLASLQHHGSYALSLTKHFGQMDLKKFQGRQQDGDDVFFSPLGRTLVAYPERWLVIANGAVSAVFLVDVLVFYRKRTFHLWPTLVAVAVLALSCFTLAISLFVFWLLMGRLLQDRLLPGDIPANLMLLVGQLFLGLTVATVIFRSIRRFLARADMCIAGLMFALGINWLIAGLLPGGSYLIFWPLAVGVFDLTIVAFFSSQRSPFYPATLVPTAIIFLLLWTPLIYLIYAFLGLNPLVSSLLGVSIGLLIVFGFSLLDLALPTRTFNNAITLSFLALGSIFVAVGALMSHRTAAHPQRDTLVYAIDHNSGTAALISTDHSLDPWQEEILRKRLHEPHPMPGYLAGNSQPVYSVVAPNLSLPAPTVTVITNTTTGSAHYLHLTVESQRHASELQMTIPPSVHISGVTIQGKKIDLEENARSTLAPFTIRIYGLRRLAFAASIELTFRVDGPFSFWVMDASLPLPAFVPYRPNDLVPSEGSDETTVCSKYIL